MTKRCLICRIESNPGCPHSFHIFPKSATKRRQWMNALKLKKIPNFNSSYICSNHFDNSSYGDNDDQKCRRRLLATAVPHIRQLPTNICNKHCNKISNDQTTETNSSAEESYKSAKIETLKIPSESANKSSRSCSEDLKDITNSNIMNQRSPTKEARHMDYINRFSGESKQEDWNPNQPCKMYSIHSKNEDTYLSRELRILLQKSATPVVQAREIDEYDYLKSHTSGICDLNPLDNILKRTAEATGVSEQTVTTVLERRKRPQDTSLDTVQQKRAKLSNDLEDQGVSPSEEDSSCGSAAEDQHADDDQDEEENEMGTLNLEFEEEDEVQRNTKERTRGKDRATSYNHRTSCADQPLLSESNTEPKIEPVDAEDLQKGKGTKPDHPHGIPCPLSPGVPSTPPPRIPQPWEVLRSHETTAAAEDHDDDVIEGLPPSPTLQGRLPGLPQGRRTRGVEKMEIDNTPTASRAKSLIQFRPSTGVPQAKELADSTKLNSRPTSSRYQQHRGSGRNTKSNMSLETGVDTERDLESETDSRSEIEVEKDPGDISLLRTLLNPRNAVGEDLKEPNPTEAMELMCLDADEDQVIRNMATGDDDILHFDWCSEYTKFEGVREKFTGRSGPTFAHSRMSPLRVFEQIWDTNIIDHIVRETNNYARELQSKRAGKLTSRMSRWKETTREEIWRFLSILMLQSLIVIKVEREYWHPSNDQLRIGDLGTLMSYNRFLLIKTCLHFTDTSSSRKHPSKLDKIMPIIAHLNKKFSSLYLPEQNVTIDESLLLWRGRLSFSEKIATKRAREGTKSLELCESRTGYLWKMEVFLGKGHIHALQEVGAVEGQEKNHEPGNATSQIVFNLMRPLFGKGHTLVMDDYYNSPLLSRLLKTNHRTDTLGTLRLNREFVPEELKAKTKENMEFSEVCFSSTKDLCVLVYLDKEIVPMISTFHPPEVGGMVKYGYYKYKPKVILDYNLSMGGIDHKDELLRSFPIERTRNLCWHKKLFRQLLNVSIHNASVIYDHGRTGRDKLSYRSFRLQLLKEMLETYAPRTVQPPRPTLSQMHLPVKVKKQRCKLCYKNKVQRSTVWSCGTCRVYLCIEGCYTEYHKELCI